jgi:hypothetical protein
MPARSSGPGMGYKGYQSTGTYTQTDTCVPSLKQLAGFAFQRLSVVSEEAIKNIEDKFSLAQVQLSCLQNQILAEQEKLDQIKKTEGHYDSKNVDKRDRRGKRNRQELDNCLKEVERLRGEVANALKLKSKYKLQVPDNTETDECQGCRVKDSRISELNESVQTLEYETDCIREMSERREQTGEVSVGGTANIRTQDMRDGRLAYNDNVRLVYMQLLSLGVSVAKCSEVVKIVLKGMTDLDVDKLPAKSTTSNFQSECESLAQMHVADVLLHNKDVTLSLDGTKKKFKEYGSFQISHTTGQGDDGVHGVNSKETLSVGILEMVRGDTVSFLDTLSSVFKDLAECFSDDSEKVNELHAQMIAHVKNLMTDRHIVNKTFKSKFEEYRKELFQKYLKDYADLSEEQQSKLVELNSLFCGLHVIANMGTQAGKALLTFEEIAVPESSKITTHSLNRGNARTFDLVFEISQSMTVSGSQRFGRLAEWVAHLHASGKWNRVISFLRHRFIVLFVDAGANYLHRQDIESFLEMLTGTNKLLLCIQDSIKSPVCVAALRALGILGILMTQPLWKVSITCTWNSRNTYDPAFVESDRASKYSCF